MNRLVTGNEPLADPCLRSSHDGASRLRPVAAYHMTHSRLPSRPHIFVAFVTAAVTVGACSLSTAASDVDRFGSGPRRILFIGNSLTAANSMPGMLVALAESAKVASTPTVDVDWLPDFALIDHWSFGEAQELIANGHYDVVVLQQGPSSVAANRDTLRLAAKLFGDVVRARGGTTVMLSVWPTVNRQADFDRATESYRLAAQDVGGMLVPAGETWRAAWRRDPNLAFYSADGLHPSALGSYAVATSIFAVLYDRSAVGLPAAIRVAGRGTYAFDAATARIVQESADEAIRQFGLERTP